MTLLRRPTWFCLRSSKEKAMTCEPEARSMSMDQQLIDEAEAAFARLRNEDRDPIIALLNMNGAQIDAVSVRIIHLRVSHARLLAAANDAVNAWGGGSGVEIDSSFERLQAAIRKAEELAS